MRSFILLLVFALASSSVLADEGEVSLDAGVSGELAWLNHPALERPGSSGLSSSTAFAVMPRVSVGGRYGLSNELEVGAGLEAAGAANVVSPEAHFENASGAIVTGTYGELVAPVRASFRVDTGYDVSAKLQLDAGPMLSVWARSALVDPKRVDSAGLPAKLPLEVLDAWNVGGFIRVGGSLDWRLLDALVLDIEPYFAASFAGAPAVRVGVMVSAAFVLPLL